MGRVIMTVTGRSLLLYSCFCPTDNPRRIGTYGRLQACESMSL